MACFAAVEARPAPSSFDSSAYGPWKCTTCGTRFNHPSAAEA